MIPCPRTCETSTIFINVGVAMDRRNDPAPKCAPRVLRADVVGSGLAGAVPADLANTSSRTFFSGSGGNTTVLRTIWSVSGVHSQPNAHSTVRRISPSELAQKLRPSSRSYVYCGQPSSRLLLVFSPVSFSAPELKSLRPTGPPIKNLPHRSKKNRSDEKPQWKTHRPPAYTQRDAHAPGGSHNLAHCRIDVSRSFLHLDFGDFTHLFDTHFTDLVAVRRGPIPCPASRLMRSGDAGDVFVTT